MPKGQKDFHRRKIDRSLQQKKEHRTMRKEVRKASKKQRKKVLDKKEKQNYEETLPSFH